MANIQKRNNAQMQPVDQLKSLLNGELRGMFYNALEKNSRAFMVSLIDLYNGDSYLQGCDPREVAMEALKAATLNLPINKPLGYAYIVPFKDKGVLRPNFIIGYKGLIQMAQRSGKYKALNAGNIYEGMEIKQNYLKGTFEITGAPLSNKIIGYFGYFELLNGYEKALYMTKEEVKEYAERYSKSYGSAYSPWKNQFDDMAQKTVLRRLLTKYGVLTTEFEKIEQLDEDKQVTRVLDKNAAVEMPTAPAADEKNDDVIDVDPDTGEIIEKDVKAPF